ncbi:UDP-N-acetylmuramate dehydrogenase [Aurantiacibacter aquimixticola]|uniref:UDP-N-acetylenolpyruvoylglucosamine reductase n=1 Tax=Aurantiacibacter aquimixticola TaxID=1958945 RepID=A0A419RSF8_9SPHN|nr:UDP-N-acetylmuramate dehydrogenase [Aurantiacibacter aquimixticola]RJY08732.1 UDP-N-acetylmuramate dehydrogenase [Aurantiacibacter aquimixticola]
MIRFDDGVIRQVERICPSGVMRNFDFASRSWWRIGGTAPLAARPRTRSDIVALRRFSQNVDLPTLVIGEMSNLLFADERVDALVLQLGAEFSRPTLVDATTVRIEAGAWVPGVARFLQQHGMSGLEHICGIPGTLGGLVMMNGGSLRRSIGEHVVTVTSVDANGDTIERTRDECDFAYRHSVFADLDEVIVDVTLRLEKGDPVRMRQTMRDILRSRRLKFPRKLPNCGSVFKSNPACYAEFGPPGAMIERAGWKGMIRGGAQVSPLHANFIVNRGGAQAVDVLSLIGDIRQSVHDQTGHLLEPEIRYVDNDGKVWTADEAHSRFIANASG